MGDRLALLVSLPLVAVPLVATLTVIGVLFSDLVEGIQARAAQMHGRATLLGAVNLLFLSVLIAALSAVGGGGLLQLFALLLVLVLAIGLAFGLAAMAPLVGEGLLPDASRTRQTVWGAAAMLLACLTPLLGWFVLFPYLALRGLGGLVIFIFTR